MKSDFNSMSPKPNSYTLAADSNLKNAPMTKSTLTMKPYKDVTQSNILEDT